MAWDNLLLLKSSGAQTTSTSGAAVDLNSQNANLSTTGLLATVNKGLIMEFRLFLTALSGTTPTMDLYIESSPDQSTWTEVCHFRQLSSTDNAFTGINLNGRQYSRYGVTVQRYIRYRTVIAGTTPSFTFSVRARGLDAVVPDVDRLIFP